MSAANDLECFRRLGRIYGVNRAGTDFGGNIMSAANDLECFRRLGRIYGVNRAGTDLLPELSCLLALS